MSDHSEFQRRRVVFLTGLAASGGTALVAMLAWRSGWLGAGAALATFQVSSLGFLIWSIAGANWVLRARTANVDTATPTDEARHRRRTYLVALLPGATFLWNRLRDFNTSTPNSIVEAIVVLALSIAGAVGIWWLFGSMMWRFGSVMRASQNKPL